MYDVDKVVESDDEMVIFLHDLASKENNDFIRRIADRLSELANKAHKRGHWTGVE